MTTKVVKKVKQFALLSIVFVGIMSCEKDIESTGVNLVDNNVFETNTYKSSVVAYNHNVAKRRASKLSQYLLGVYKNQDFGQLNASIVAQLLPTSSIEFGTDPTIDRVVLTIPYQATNKAENGQAPDFELDSVLGNQSEKFILSVYQLEDYLNTLNPSDPSEELNYFTDQSYNYNATPLYSATFSPDPEDTIKFIQRPEVIIDFATGQTDEDTLRTFVTQNGSPKLVPAIRLELDEDFFADNFFTNPDAMLNSSAFTEFFNGLYIEATQDVSPNSSLMSLNLNNSATNLTIFYTNTVLRYETITLTGADGTVTIISETDLNGDGDTVDENVPVRTKQTATFNFDGIITNTFDRDYAGSDAQPSLDNPNTLSGDEKLYLQGAAGSIALIDLFTLDNLEELRNNQWLINEANLTFYVDQENTADLSAVPERLFVYDYEEDQQLTDVITEGIAAFDGTLELDSDNKPYRYIVNVTDYISNVLKSDNPIDFSKLAVKVYNSTDSPENFADVDVDDYNWNPKGVVLYGNQSSDLEKKLKLEIKYTKVN